MYIKYKMSPKLLFFERYIDNQAFIAFFGISLSTPQILINQILRLIILRQSLWLLFVLATELACF